VLSDSAGGTHVRTSSEQVQFVVMKTVAFRKVALLGGILWGMVVGAGSLWAQETKTPPWQRANAAAAQADSLMDERQFEAARQAYRRAQGLYRGVDSLRQVAVVTGDIGVTHYHTGDLEAALRAFEEAVALARRAGAREKVANLLNNIGLIEWRRGQYDAALQHLEEAVRIHRAESNRTRVGRALNNIANIHEERGEYQDALRKYRQALNTARMQRDSVDVASYLNNIGLVLRSQGRYDEALRYHQRALDLHRTLGSETGVTAALNNIGIVWRERDEYDRALQSYREALRINRELEDRAAIATNLTNIGVIRQRQGHNQEAADTLQKALRISRELESRPRVAIILNDLAAVRRSQGVYDEALALHEKALRMNRAIGRPEGAAKALDGIGLTYLEQGRYAAADSVLRASIAVTDTLIEAASGADRRDFLAQEIGRFHRRVVAQVRAGTPEAALRTLERSRTRVFADRLAGPSDDRGAVPPIDSLQRTLGPEEAAVLYANTDAPGPITALIVTRTSVQAREVADAAFVDWARRAFEDELDWLRRREDPLMAEAKGVDTDETLASLVRLYRRDLAVPPQRQLLAEERRRVLARELYALLIAPLEGTLAGVDEIVMVPDGALAYLPFETLQNRRGAYLVDRWRVQYTQSLRVLHLLRRREAQSPDSTAQRSLLALGGAVYDAATYAADTAASTSGAVLADAASDRALRLGEGAAPEPVRALGGDGLASGGAPTRSYRQLGFGPDRWYNLGGTLRETRALGRIVGSSTLLVGENASERTLREFSRSGALDDYRALHFATHGFVVPEAPSLSALVLSEVSRQASRERRPARRDTAALTAVDGYLNMREIARLDVDAEFVALSACKTGLGRIYRGSGAVSLAQAFLRAGAGAVAVSLWPVYDASTSRFMQAVYRRAWTGETSWAAAIAQTKRAFIAGDHGERLRAPRFWAPFVYYGREAR
jgi:CHAT domain-containing protein/tetratricopeptide (TPR) repeat protein